MLFTEKLDFPRFPHLKSRKSWKKIQQESKYARRKRVGEPIPDVLGFQPNTWIKANQVIPPSPQAASLGRYGNIPVNYYIHPEL